MGIQQVQDRTIEEADRAAKQWSISTTLQARYLRYIHITAWALPIAVTAGLLPAFLWFAVTVIFGLIRGQFEEALGRKLKKAPKGSAFGAGYTAMAWATSAVWAGAPVLVWFSGHPAAPLASLCLLAAGYLLVITQFRGSPKRAFIVSSPYGLSALLMGLTLQGIHGTAIFYLGAATLGLTIAHAIFHAYLTHRKIIEAQIAQNSLIAQLKEARDAAESANQAKSAFLAMVSHEIRTPLNGVLGGAQLLQASELDDRQKELVSMLKTSGSSLLNILNDVLDLSKIEADSMKIELIETRLPELLKGAHEMWRPLAEEKALTLTYEAGDLPELVTGDPTRITQIINNLLSNAIKFTETGTVTLKASAKRRADGSAMVTLAVKDTGIGITEEALERLFKPFEQMDDSITRRFGGTGLGLTICQRLAGLMGGEVCARSTPGEGSVFTLEIPMEVIAWDAEAPQAAHAVAMAAEAEERPLSVVVAGDNPGNRQVVQAFLDSKGHAVTFACDGAEAVKTAQAEAFDAILMDVHMPVMDGLSATREIRAGGANARTPVIMLSASALPEEQTAGLEAGADAYLTKPIDPEALFDALRRHGRGEREPLAKAS